MASAMRVFKKFRASDGRIKIATLSGVSVFVAVIALLVGVLPVFATEPGPTVGPDPDNLEGVDPVLVDWGGGSAACDDELISLEGDDEGKARGPSAARYEAHLNNPRPGENLISGDDPDETEITITVDENDEFFTFSIEAETGMVAYDVVVNGGKKSNHYAYDGNPRPEIVPLDSDSHLSAPTKDNRDEVHKLSHINLCYDLPPVTFVCGGDPEGAILFGEGIFAGATGQIFNNSNPNVGCVEDEEKQGLFFINNQAEEATLDFGNEGGVVAGRADFTKNFDSPTDPKENFEDLEYDPDADGEGFVDVEWCIIRDAEEDDGNQFEDVLGTGLYPSLLNDNGTPLKDAAGDATACKVAEIENADGVQVTVVYFEFEDPTFR